MINIEDIPLQPLRISEGWTVKHNRFYELEPKGELKIAGVTNDDGWLLFDQDLLQMEHSKRKVFLDLGWYPDEDPNGRFRVALIRDDDWENPLLRYETKDKTEIVEVINNILTKVTSNEF